MLGTWNSVCRRQSCVLRARTREVSVYADVAQRLVRRLAVALVGVPLVAIACSRPPVTPEPRPAESSPPARSGEAAPPPIVASNLDSASAAADAPSTLPFTPPRTPADTAAVALGARRLLVPVAGVDAARILDSFNAARGARTHNALDIMAPRGTPVVSADDGTILRVSENRAGGLTVYTADPERRLVYYYAHMDRYARGIAAGQPVSRGDTLGFVGTTGNAPRDIPHLHFQMMLMHPEGRYWSGTPVNPLPFLLAPAESDDPDE